jgi:hypothetical protein
MKLNSTIQVLHIRCVPGFGMRTVVCLYFLQVSIFAGLRLMRPPVSIQRVPRLCRSMYMFIGIRVIVLLI